jgi:hypothetical protein
LPSRWRKSGGCTLNCGCTAALHEIEQMLRRCDEIEHLLFMATPVATLPG